jgi:multidrug efflux pump subunit AcrA (membrane-fusion protein)
LEASVRSVVGDFLSRGTSAIDALYQQDALAAQDAQVARDAKNARAALDARAAQDARATRAALDAQAARAARAALDARDALAALDALDALDAQDARVAQAARAAQDARAARAARAALDARVALDARAARDAQLQRLAKWCVNRGYWYVSSDLSFIVTTWLGAQTEEVKRWSGPLFEAFCAGAWFLYWTEGAVYWIAKPEVHLNEARRAHREDGPALVSDLEDLYFLDGNLVTEQIVMRPETITAQQVDEEGNLEIQRIMIARMGPGKYLSECGAKLIDMDSLTLPESGPRALMEDARGERWLVGTDTSTDRVYHMAVPREARTCSEAHKMISGLDREDRLVFEA